MKRNGKDSYSRYITYRVTDEMLATLKKAAAAKHLSVAMYARQVTMIAATKDAKNASK